MLFYFYLPSNFKVLIILIVLVKNCDVSNQISKSAYLLPSKLIYKLRLPGSFSMRPDLTFFTIGSPITQTSQPVCIILSHFFKVFCFFNVSRFQLFFNFNNLYAISSVLSLTRPNDVGSLMFRFTNNDSFLCESIFTLNSDRNTCPKVADFEY